MDYRIIGYVVMDILNVVDALVHYHRGEETLSIIVGEDERCASELCSFTWMGPPHPVTHEELICVYHIFPVSISIKPDLVEIPHLLWARLDVE